MGAAPAPPTPTSTIKRGATPKVATINSQFVQGTNGLGLAPTTVYGQAVGVAGTVTETPQGSTMLLKWLNQPGSSTTVTIASATTDATGNFRFPDFEAISDQLGDNDLTTEPREPRIMQVQSADGRAVVGPEMAWTVQKSATQVKPPAPPIIIDRQTMVTFSVTVVAVPPGGKSNPPDVDGLEPIGPTGYVRFTGPTGLVLAEVPVNEADGRATANIAINLGGDYQALYIPDNTRTANPTVGWGQQRYTGSSVTFAVQGPAPIAAPVVSSLNPGDSVTSGEYRLVMQEDGNLVTYKGNAVVWASYTFIPGSFMRVQTDGNVVIYSPEGDPIWHVGTGGSPNENSTLKLHNDGNLVLYRSDNLAIWDSYGSLGQGSYYAGARRVSVLETGQSLLSANGAYQLVMQPDGNLVVYHRSFTLRPVVWSGTYVPGSRLVLQADGNLVIYGPDARPVWYTVTYGNPNPRLLFQNDGNLVLYNSAGAPVWDFLGYTGKRAVFA